MRNNILKKSFNIAELKGALLIVLYLTIVISVFDFNTVIEEWLKEVLRNFILITSITGTFYISSIFFDYDTSKSTLTKAIVIIFHCATISIVGGFAGWKINGILVGFNVTHPAVFFLTIFLVSLFSVFTFHIYASWKKASETLAKKREIEQKLIQLKTRSELELLRSKLNPHFLFNALNSAMSLIHSDPEKSEEMLQKLACLLRDIQNRKEYVKLTDEIELIEEYLAIEKIRFGERLEYSINIDEKTQNVIVPSMILQPLVENSLKHGIADLSKGIIKISSVPHKEGKIKISVFDNGRGFETGQNLNGFGFSGLRERLGLIYGNDHELAVSNGSGCNIDIIIPVKNI